MPINNFRGETFVAFIDISGFKELMGNEKRALDALKTFYSSGYRNLRGRTPIQGLFISDCGILFVSKGPNGLTKLRILLETIQRINKKMLDSNYMLTTSIAYGEFGYQEMAEYYGIEKNFIYGNGYVQAFLDNEIGKPKIQPGLCRIVKAGLPSSIKKKIGNAKQRQNGVLKLIREREGDESHYYFYWNVRSRNQIDLFERNYLDSYFLKYSGMLKALKGA